jgi:hypothetical protein
MLTYAQWRMEVVGMLLYTQVFIAFLAIQAVLRLFLLFRLYGGSIKAASCSTRRYLFCY